MRIIQTFWSPIGAQITKNNGGWLCPVINIMSLALSCVLLRRFYDEVELYTTKEYQELFERLKLPYTKIHATHNNEFMNNLPPKMWAYSKIYTYSLQTSPFLHVDGDIFIWEPFDKKLLQKDIIVQSVEENLSSYKRNIGLLHSIAGANIPKWVSANEKYPMAYNCGLFGANDLSLVHKYCNTAFLFLKKNMDVLRNSRELKATFNTLPEQYSLYNILTEKERSNVGAYSNKILKKSDDFKIFGDFLSCPNKVKFIHSLSTYKKNLYINEFISFVLKQEASECYNAIVSFFETKGYYSPFTKEDYKINHHKYSENLLKYLSSSIKRKNRYKQLSVNIGDELLRLHDKHQCPFQHFKTGISFPTYSSENNLSSNKSLHSRYIMVNPNHSIVRCKYNIALIVQNNLKIDANEDYSGLFFSLKYVDDSRFYRYTWLNISELILVEQMKSNAYSVKELLSLYPNDKREMIIDFIQKLYDNQIISLVEKQSDVTEQPHSNAYTEFENNLKNNSISALKWFLKLNKISVDCVMENKQYSTVFDITQSLQKAGLSITAVKCPNNQKHLLSLPFITIICYNGQLDVYVVVKNIQNGYVTFYNSLTSNEEICSEAMFDKMWNGIVIMLKR